MNVEPIPALSDNYIWCLSDGTRAWVVDPGEAAPVAAHLAARGLRLDGILVTHWHPDHIGGIPALIRDCAVPVIGPEAEAARIPTLTRKVTDGERVETPFGIAQVLAVPGHTLGHVAYRLADWLFCGDTLFSAGCGRLFEGTPAQMAASLARLDALPEHTRIACTHEYTLANLAFARAVEPENEAVTRHLAQVSALRAEGKPSLPSTLAVERAINPFLRLAAPRVIETVEAREPGSSANAVSVFAALRRWKDGFKPS